MTMSVENNEEQSNSHAEAEPLTTPSDSTAADKATLRSRISSWLGERPLSSVVVASVFALLLGIGIGHTLDRGHGREPFGRHQMGSGFDFDRDGRGPKFGPDQGQFGPGLGPDRNGPGQGPFSPDQGNPNNFPPRDDMPLPLPSTSPN